MSEATLRDAVTRAKERPDFQSARPAADQLQQMQGRFGDSPLFRPRSRFIMRVSPVCRDAHSRGVTADEAKVDRQPRDRQRRKDKEAGEEQEGEKTELATITKAGGLKGAKLSIRSRAGSETDSIAYFWPFAALREVTSMQEDPSPIRFHPSMPALFIPLGYAAGVGWNHVPSFAY